MRILLVGIDAPAHVGRFLLRAARDLGHESLFLSSDDAHAGPGIPRRLLWKLSRRPWAIRGFNEELLARAESWGPQVVLTTGQAPLLAQTLRHLADRKVVTANYSTDDPWNPGHRAGWFLRALPAYHHVFTPRRSTIHDFQGLGCRHVSWMPFAYAPDVHHRVATSHRSDIAFIGGADRDRVPWIEALATEGFDLSLWGAYWGRFPKLRPFWKGFADPQGMREVLSGTRVALTLMRQANRDSHCMRSYEVAAIGAPILAEDTTDHRNLYGPPGEAALYFSSRDEMLAQARWLVANPREGAAMGERAQARLRASPNTYADRLNDMLHLATQAPLL